MNDRPRKRAGSDPDDPLRTLLESLAAQADLLNKYLEQVYEEAFLETAGERGRLTLRIDGPLRRLTDRQGDATAVEFGDGIRGGRPPAHPGGITVEYRRGSGQVTVQAGREAIVVGAGAAEPSVAQLVGIYRAVVVNTIDPLGRGRLQLQIPAVQADTTPWALPAIPPTADSLPEPGDAVWVLFEDGDPDYPVWLGAIS